MDNTPPDWAMKEARRRIAASYNGDLPVGHGKTDPSGIAYNPSVVKPLAEMIAKHEQAPADPDELAVVEILNAYLGTKRKRIFYTSHVSSGIERSFNEAVKKYRELRKTADAS